METYTLDQLIRSKEPKIVRIAEALIKLNYPRHSHFEIVLRQVIQ